MVMMIMMMNNDDDDDDNDDVGLNNDDDDDDNSYGVARIIGDTLDQDVRKCEREIRALQTTLEHLNARNAAYRESFQKIDLKGV